MKLYSAPGSCSTATEIALTEAGADFEVATVDLMGDRKLPDGRDISELNPKGYVPVLELDDGSLLTENIAVLQYVADRYPAASLAPPNGTMERTRLQEWLGFVTSEVHKAYGHMFNPQLPAEMRDILTGLLTRRYAYLDDHLAGNDFLLGDDYSIADIYLFIVSSWAPMLGYDLAPFKNIEAWQQRVGGRPAVSKVMASLGHAA